MTTIELSTFRLPDNGGNKGIMVGRGMCVCVRACMCTETQEKKSFASARQKHPKTYLNFLKQIILSLSRNVYIIVYQWDKKINEAVIKKKTDSGH